MQVAQSCNTVWWHQFCCFLRSRVTSVCQCCCCGREHNTGQCHCLQVSFLPLWHWQGTKTQNQGVSSKVKFCFLSTWNVVMAQLEERSLPGLVPDSECHEGKRTGVCISPACSQHRGPTWCLPQHFSAHVQGLQTGSGFLVPRSRLHLNSSDNRDNLYVSISRAFSNCRIGHLIQPLM